MPVLDSFGPYISARVHGMKRSLLKRSEIEAMLDRADLKALSDGLISSPYGDEMAEALTRYEGADAIEDAVSRNLVNTFSKLYRMCSGQYDSQARIFVGRWDLESVKALLRNRHHQLDSKTGAESLFPGPSMPVALLEEMASQDSMETLVRALAAWNGALCGAMVVKLPEYNEAKSLRVLEEALDRAYFVDNLRRLSGGRDGNSRSVKRLLRMEIDRINLRILFEPRGPDASPEDVIPRLIPRGLLSEKTLRDMAAANAPERAAALLEGTIYSHLAESVAAIGQTGNYSRVERLFEMAFVDRLRHAALHHALGISILMWYTWLKFNEVKNLRLIVRGLSAGMTVDRIREEILYG